jgi:hypothetical protein
MKEIFLRQNLAAISCQVSSFSVLEVSAGKCQRALVDKLGTIRKADGDA